MFTLKDFLKLYGSGESGIFVEDDGEIVVNAWGNACISIEGLCEELTHEEIYRLKCWPLYCDKQVKSFQIIGGGSYPVELSIMLYGMEV